MITTAETQTAADAELITETYRGLAPSGRSIPLLAIYSMFDMDLGRFHAALIHLAVTDRSVFIEPETKRRNLADLDREIALRVGGEAKNLIAIQY